MKPFVNLAREPFRNRRLFWLSVLALFAVTGWGWLEAAGQKARLQTQLVTQQESLRLLKVQLGKAAKPTDPLTGQTADNKIIAISPEDNKTLLAASELIERRGFSWSQLFNDIERGIPRNVRVLRIAVNRIQSEAANAANAPPGTPADEVAQTVELTLEVIAKSNLDVTRMMTDFERTGTFAVSPRESKSNVIEGTTDVQWALELDYHPPLVRGFRPSPNQVAENNGRR